MTTWPKNADGTNKRFGDMTREEQREQMAAAGKRLEAEFADPARQAALAAFMDAEVVTDIYEHGGGSNAEEIAADLG